MAVQTPKPKAAETGTPSPAPSPAPAPTSDGDERVNRLLEVAERQAEMIAALTTQLATQAVDTADREREAAEAAASKKLPPKHTDVEGRREVDGGEPETRMFDNETKCREAGFEPVDVVVFRSRGDAFRVIRVGRHRWTAPNGAEQTTDGRDYQFVTQGLGLSELRVRNSNVVEYLRGRPGFNLEFVEVGKEPGAAPNPEIVFERIMSATVELDDERLAELEEQERLSHKRKVVLDAIRHARRQIRGRAG